MKRNKRTLTDKNGEELFALFPKSIALGQALTRLAYSAVVGSTG
jgi:hypothetical protein